MKVVSERLNWRASACIVASSSPSPSSKTHSGLPVRRAVAGEDVDDAVGEVPWDPCAFSRRARCGPPPTARSARDLLGAHHRQRARGARSPASTWRGLERLAPRRARRRRPRRSPARSRRRRSRSAAAASAARSNCSTGMLAALARWMRKISARIGGVGQVDEEDLVEAALAQQLRRQRLDVVGGGDQEDAALALGHPGEQRAQHAPRHAAVAVAVAGARPFSISSIHSTHGAICVGGLRAPRAGCARSRRGTCCRARRSRGAAAARPRRRRPPCAARLLPAPCTPSSSMPLGTSSASVPASPQERVAAQLEPVLQARQAADVGRGVSMSVTICSVPSLPSDSCFSLQHARHVLHGDRALVLDRLADQAARVVARQARPGAAPASRRPRWSAAQAWPSRW